MEKKEYVQSVVELVRSKNISLYTYYYLLAMDVKKEKDFHLSELEIHNPFIGIQDYKLLLESNEEEICEYFALSMEKVILLNLKEMGISSKGLAREDIEEVINEEMKQEDLSKEDIEEVINEEMKQEDLSKEDIEEVINEEMKQEDLSKEDIEEVINEKMKKTSSIKSFFMNISKKISNVLNGFAVIREKDNSAADLYYYNAEDQSLSAKRTFSDNTLKAENGIYINFQEYIDRLFDSIYDKYEDIQAILFQDEDGKEISFYHFASKMFEILHEAGSLRFGEELAKNKPSTYQELISLKIKGEADYQGHMLKKGVYVRRDLVDEIVSKYKVKVVTSTDSFYEENQNVK